MTVSDLLHRCVQFLENHASENYESADLEARVLLCHVLDISPAGLIAHPHRVIGEDQANQVEQLVEQRAKGIPIAYLTSKRSFWTLDLCVNSHVLIPRHETELVVETVLGLCADSPPTRILDLGTGSGAIALALASEFPHCKISAVDVSPAALQVAELNARNHGIKNVEFYESDWFEHVTAAGFDVVCSNPPYVAEGDENLARGDVRFEPQQALVSGKDGLSDIRSIARHAKSRLAQGGFLILEHGYDQGEGVREILARVGFNNVSTLKDLAGLERVTVGQNPVDEIQ